LHDASIGSLDTDSKWPKLNVNSRQAAGDCPRLNKLRDSQDRRRGQSVNERPGWGHLLWTARIKRKQADAHDILAKGGDLKLDSPAAHRESVGRASA
jgi:hypothetical protein